MTGSRSEIVFEALPADDPQVRQPDIAQARECSAGSPRSTFGGPAPYDRGLRASRSSSAPGCRGSGTGPGENRYSPQGARFRVETPWLTEAWNSEAGRHGARDRARASPARARRAPQAPAGALLPAADGDAAPRRARRCRCSRSTSSALYAAHLHRADHQGGGRAARPTSAPSLHETRRTVAFAYLITVLLFARSGLYGDRAPSARACRGIVGVAVPGDAWWR